MGMPEDLLERRESPLYLYYSTFGQNPATIAPISYFLNAAHGQIRFDVSTGSVVSWCSWQSRTSALAMMLQKCTTILILSLWLKSRFQDLVRWHQGSSMRHRRSIARMRHRISITSQVSF
jgi:predicted alpha/beta hydrolase